jgi:preprotein translocase subunit SecG
MNFSRSARHEPRGASESKMNWVESVVLVLHVLVAVAICGFVLLQHGKGADMGAAFGSGSSGSLFGAAGSANFLSRTTAVLAALFFVSSLGLTWFATTRATTRGSVPQGVMERVPVPKSDVPGAPSGGQAPAPQAPAPAGGTAAEPAGSKSGEVPK